MTIEKVEAYKVTSGEIFLAEGDAEKREAELALEVWYIDNQLHISPGAHCAPLEDLLEWLDDNEEQVLDYLGARKKR